MVGGKPEALKRLYSHREDVTLFGGFGGIALSASAHVRSKWLIGHGSSPARPWQVTLRQRRHDASRTRHLPYPAFLCACTNAFSTAFIRD